MAVAGALDVVFTTDNPRGSQRLAMIAHRTALDEPFAAATVIPDFAALAPTRVTFSDDGFDAVLSLVGGTQLLESTRSASTDAWPAPTAVAFAPPQPYADELAWLSPDGLSLWFDRAGTSVYDQHIYTTTRARRTDPWPAPALVHELASPTDSAFHPSLDAAQQTICFATTLAVGTPMIQVLRATRADLASPFSAPTPIALRTDPLDQADPTASRDGCEPVFASPPGTVDDAWAVWAWSRRAIRSAAAPRRTSCLPSSAA